jgi:uncharacterized protein
MPRKYFRKYLPDHASIREHKYLRWAGSWLHHPNLWHLNRHSVAGGVAAGIIGGLIPLPIQIAVAALLALLFRVNLPVAMATTLLSNPLTWPFIIVAAIAIGEFIIGNGQSHATTIDWTFNNWTTFLPDLWAQLSGLGTAFIVGETLLAALLAVLGYATVQLAWRVYLLVYLRRRAQRRR